ncbi:hypothetical protein KY382_29930 [Pseudomonas monteilii]|nr:hypothetical protein [Pseudomonas monteilii]
MKSPVKKPCKICLLLLSNHTEKQPEVNAQQKKQRKKQFFVVSAKEIMSFFQVPQVSMVKYFRTVAYRF